MPGRRITFRNPLKLRFFSFLSLIWPVLLGAGLIVSVYGIAIDDKDILKKGAIILASFVIVFFMILVSVQKLKCPVCLNPVIANKKCARSPQAKKLFGISYTYKVILDCTFTNYFKCQYCGERVRNAKN